MWGYEGKYVDTRYLWFRLRGSPLQTYTIESLAHDVATSGNLLVSVDRHVFDVTASREMYDPRKITARYSMFVGKDCTRMYVNGCFRDQEQCTWDVRKTGYDEEWVDKTVRHWVDFYQNHSKYWLVGYLEVDESVDAPPKCLNGVQYPS